MLWLHKMIALLLICLGISLVVISLPVLTPDGYSSSARYEETGPAADTGHAQRHDTLIRIVAALFILAGIYKGFRAYRIHAGKKGILISPAWLAVFCDLILICGGAFFTLLALDALWIGAFDQPSLIGLEPEWTGGVRITGLHFVSIPALFLALPLLTLFFTSLSCQRVHIDSDGIAVTGALFSDTLAWSDLESVSLREQKNPFAFTVMDFRGLQQVVDFQGSDPDMVITLNEPATRRKKRDILSSLNANAPEDKQQLLTPLEGW